MGAQVDHFFDGGYRLDEGRLRKVNSLIGERFAKVASKPTLRFRVYRGDSYQYETESVDDVLKEDNDDWRAITRLDLISSEPTSPGDLRFHLSFGKNGCGVEITGDDRDVVFLLFSDLREYLTHEVLFGWGGSRSRTLRFNLYPAAVIVAGCVVLMIVLSRMDMAQGTAALASENINDKINFLLKRSIYTLNILQWIALGAGLGILLSANLVRDGIVNFFFPSNVFLFGKRLESYERRRKAMHNFFWVVVVGLVVSIVAGIAVWRFTLPH